MPISRFERFACYDRTWHAVGIASAGPDATGGASWAWYAGDSCWDGGSVRNSGSGAALLSALLALLRASTEWPYPVLVVTESPFVRDALAGPAFRRNVVEFLNALPDGAVDLINEIAPLVECRCVALHVQVGDPLVVAARVAAALPRSARGEGACLRAPVPSIRRALR